LAYVQRPSPGNWRSGFEVEPGGRVVARIREIDRWGIAWEAELPEHGVVPVSVAAKLFGVSVMTVHNWIANGLRSDKRHGVVAIPVQSLIQLAVDRGMLPDEEDQFPHY
jgi:hypothetical protein